MRVGAGVCTAKRGADVCRILVANLVAEARCSSDSGVPSALDGSPYSPYLYDILMMVSLGARVWVACG